MTDHMKPRPEDEYFAREDAEKKRKLALQVKKETEAVELARLKALHHLRCPKCGLPLQEVTYAGVHAEVCFACNGVFLDRRDLEQIVKHDGNGVMDAILNWFKGEQRP
jgi:Zn-finger nucleic acid-binding protein